MALLAKVLGFLTGSAQPTEASVVTASAGSSSANAIPALGSAGTLDPSMLPTASASALGAVKVDGTSITIASGVISAGASSGPSFIVPRDVHWEMVKCDELGNQYNALGAYLGTNGQASTTQGFDANGQNQYGWVTSTATSGNAFVFYLDSNMTVSSRSASLRATYGQSVNTGIDAWIYINQYLGFTEIKASSDMSTSNNVGLMGFRFYPALSPYWVCYVGDGAHAGQTFTTSVSPTVNLQTFDIFWNQATNKVTFYINGVLVGTITPTYAFPAGRYGPGIAFQNTAATAVTGYIGELYAGQGF